MKTLFKGGLILTATTASTPESSPDLLVLEDGYLVVEDTQIVKVGQGEIEGEYDRVVDLKGRWVMPGWVNTHGHAAMSVLRGVADDDPLETWLEKKIWPLEAKFTSETVRWGASLAILEMLKSGTTCFLDMYDYMDEVAQVVEEAGIRGVLTRGIIGLGTREEQDEKLKEATAFAKAWRGRADGRITTMMAPHSAYTCPPDYILRIVEQAEELDLPVHTHLSETEEEVRQIVNRYHKRPVAHLKEIGLFSRPTLVAHAVHLTEEEMDELRAFDVKIAHNPISNLKLGSGIAPVPELLKKGFRVSVGTDSAASNNNLDMFQEVRMAALLHKGAGQNPTLVPAETAFKMGTAWGAEALFLPQIGTLEAGKEADFIVINPHRSHLTPQHQALSHIIYSASGADVEDVYIQGRQVLQNGKALFLDEEKIYYHANLMAEQLKRNL